MERTIELAQEIKVMVESDCLTGNLELLLGLRNTMISHPERAINAMRRAIYDLAEREGLCPECLSELRAGCPVCRREVV